MTLELISQAAGYTGNGGTQSFVLGWQPAIVMTLTTRTSGPATGRGSGFKTVTMSGNNALRLAKNAAAITAMTINSDGFTLGADDSVNRNGQQHYYAAVRAGPWIVTGTYTGTGAQQDIVLNRQPSMLLIARLTPSPPSYFVKMNTMSSDESFDYIDASPNAAVLKTTPGISLLSNGFRVPAGYANNSSNTYHYAAFFSGEQGPTRGTREHSVVNVGSPSSLVVALGTGQQPVFLWTMYGPTSGSGAGVMGWKFGGTPTWDTGNLITDWGWGTSVNGDVRLDADGFTLGSLWYGNATTQTTHSHALVY